MSASIVAPGALEITGDALAAQLALVFPPSLFSMEFMPPRVNGREWQRLQRRTPFVGLGWGKLEAGRSTPARSFTGLAEWSVFLVTRNSAGTRGRYWGDSYGPGLFQMVRAAVVALHGFTIAGVGSAQVAGVANAYAEGWDDDEKALAVLDVRVGTTLGVGSDLGGIAPPDFLRMGESWSFDADAATGAPADGVLNVRGS